MQIYGRIGDARAGSKLTFGDFGQYANQGWNVFAGEYGTTGIRINFGCMGNWVFI